MKHLYIILKGEKSDKMLKAHYINIIPKLQYIHIHPPDPQRLSPPRFLLITLFKLTFFFIFCLIILEPLIF